MKINNFFKKKGQSLVEIIVSVAVGTLIIGSAIGALIVTIQSNLLNRNTNFASTLGQDLLDNVRSVAESNWVQVYDMPKGTDLSLAAPKEITNENPLTGTVYINIVDKSTVNGIGTNFFIDLVVGDFIDISGRTYKVAPPIGATSIKIASPYTGPDTPIEGVKAIKLIGTATVTKGSKDVLVSGVDVSTDLAAGDYVKIGGQTLKIGSVSFVSPNTLLTLVSDYPGVDGEGLKIYREFGIRTVAENITPSGSVITYTRSFIVEDVNRGNCGTGSIVTTGTTVCFSINNIGDVINDPSTQKVTSKVSWIEGSDTVSAQFSEYLTRSKKNETMKFGDWSGASGIAGPFTQPNIGNFDRSASIDNSLGLIKLISPNPSGYLVSSTYDTGYPNGVAFNSVMWKGTPGTGASAVKFQFASSNSTNGGSGNPAIGQIDSMDSFAWNDVIGWIDFFNAPGGPSTVTASKMTRWATSADGEFALDCASTPSGNVCPVLPNPPFFVSNDAGKLAGWAWNSSYGWVSFCGDAASGSAWNGSTWVCPAVPTYQVIINQVTGEFSGWAWNDIIGWISFNEKNCDVDDNGFIDVSCGGDNSTDIAFVYKVKVAAPSSGIWNYYGPDKTETSYYSLPDQGKSVPLVTANHNNDRYYRYKVFLETDAASPIIDDVIVNWSP
jgi:hypothetical protein